MKKTKKRKKVRIKFTYIITLLLLLFLIFLGLVYLINIKVTNIFIKGNDYLSDQKIIEIASLEDYPSTVKTPSSKIKKEMEKNIYIKCAKVSKKKFTQVFIEVEENRPLFFYQSTNKTVLLDKKETKDKFDVPVLINYVPDFIYDDFIKKLGNIKKDVLTKISEIKYSPDMVDESRFLFTMNDSNYVYITLNKLEKMNNYNDIVKKFDNKKGILYLNSGGYFEIFK